MVRKFYTQCLTLMVVVGLAFIFGSEGGATGEAVEHATENCKARGGIEKLISDKHAKDISYKAVCKDSTVINVVDDD